MTDRGRSDVLRDAAETLRAAHHASRPLVLPNAWDAASARAVEAAGFPVVATSSHAVADVLGTRDDDSGDPNVVFAYLARIAAAVGVPVTADVEAGYRLAATDLVGRLLAAGIVGCNLEDTDHHGPDVLVDADRQADRIAAVRAAALEAGVPLVINARVDTFIRRVGEPAEQLGEGIRRAARYLDAGADCVYPIGLVDRDAIREFVAAVDGPVNLLVRPDGPDLTELAGLGARRISFGGGLHRQVIDSLKERLAAIAAGSPGVRHP